MKKILLILLFGYGTLQAQTISPTLHTAFSKPTMVSISGGGPLDAVSMFYDAPNFRYRDYRDTAEVKTYLNGAKWRAGKHTLFVHDGGTLNGDGTYTGGTTQEWWFRDCVADSCLIEKTETTLLSPSDFYTDSSGVVRAKWQGTTVSGLRTASDIAADVIYQTTDYGGGQWYYDAADDSSADNTGTIIVNGTKRLKRIFEGVINAEWFGVKADGTNIKVPLRLAAEYINSLGGGTLRLGKGRYYVSHDSSNAVASFRGLSNIKFEFSDATFYTDDYSDFVDITLTNAGTVATATSSTPHGFLAGQLVTIKEATDSVYNAYYVIQTVPNSTTFTYNLLATPAGGATAKARLADLDRTLFRFDSCKNIDLGTLRFEGVVQPQYMQARLGYVVTKINNYSENITGKIIASGVYAAVKSGEHTYDIGNSKNFNLTIEGNDMGYAFAMYKSGDNSVFNVKAETLHRGGYLTGANHVIVNAWIKNYDIAGVLVGPAQGPSSQMYGTEDIELNIHDIGTTGRPSQVKQGQLSRNMVTISGYFVDDSVKVSNIRINLYGKNVAYLSPVAGRTYSTMASIEDVTVSGLIDQSGLDSTHIYGDFDFGSEPLIYAGRYSGITLRNYKVITPPGTPIGFSRLLPAGLVDNPIFNNYQSATPLFQSLPSGRKIEKRGTLVAGAGVIVDSTLNRISLDVTNGTTNTLTKYTGSSTAPIGNSTITDDGTTVTVSMSGAGAVGPLFSLRNTATAASGNTSTLRFNASSATSRYSEISGVNDGSNNIDLVFVGGAGANIGERTRMKADGQWGFGTTTPAISSVIEMKSSNKGFIPPRLTSAEINALSPAVFGLTAFSKNTQDLRFYDSVQIKWRRFLKGDTTIITNGMIPIGRTSTGDFAIANITSTDGTVTVTNGAGTINLANSFISPYTTKTANYTLTNSDYTVDCTTGTFTITLPTAVGITGRIYVIKNTGAGTITIATTSSQTIDNAAPGTVAAGAMLRVQSTGANWIII